MWPADSAISAAGLLADFSRAGAIGWSAVHTANTLGRLFGEADQTVLLAAGLCVQVMESGSVCLPLAYADQIIRPAEEAEEPALPWPDPDEWRSALAASPMVSCGEEPAWNNRPIRMVDDQLYLERCWIAEERVRLAINARLVQTPPPIEPAVLERALDVAFADADSQTSGVQRAAVQRCLSTRTSVIAGGPGTGKTWTIAKLLSVLDQTTTEPLTVALAAFTGKAAARIQQALDAAFPAQHRWTHLRLRGAQTLHCLLEAVPGNGFRRDATNPLAVDVLVVDEMSMVSLPLMVAMVEALLPTTRLVLVGDPDQLVSVEAGAVLADIVDAHLPVSATDPRPAVTHLTGNRRFQTSLSTLPPLIRGGHPEEVTQALRNNPAVTFIEAEQVDPSHLTSYPGLWDEVSTQMAGMLAAALRGDRDEALRILDSHRLLCAHREGPYGVRAWSGAIARALKPLVVGVPRQGQWHPGRPVLATRNAHDVGISNGDTGVAIWAGGRIQVAMGSPGSSRIVSPWVVDSPETMHALTVHKSQGSEYDRVTLVLPPPSSPLLTRQLLYTALTRAKTHLSIIGSMAAIAHAVSNPAQRATGLATRLVASH